MSEEKKPLTIRERKQNILDVIRAKWDEEIAPLVPAHINESRLVGLMSAAFTSTPALLKCAPLTMLDAITQTFALGLEPNTPLMHGWILPYADKNLSKESGGKNTHRAVPIIGYKGWLDLATRQGNVKSVDARAVYGKDVNDGRFAIGTKDGTPYVEYRDDPFDDGTGREDKDIVGAYARINGKDGRIAQVWLARWELNKLESSVRGGWKSSSKFPTRYKGMVRKAAIRAIFNRGEWPISSNHMRNAIDLEQRLDSELAADDVRIEDPERTRTEQLLDDLQGKTEEAEAEGPDFTDITDVEFDVGDPSGVSLEEAQALDEEDGDGEKA